MTIAVTERAVIASSPNDQSSNMFVIQTGAFSILFLQNFLDSVVLAYSIQPHG
jgi:hypothetical protein